MFDNLKQNIPTIALIFGYVIYIVFLIKASFPLAVLWIMCIVYLWLLSALILKKYTYNAFLYVLCSAGVAISISFFFLKGVEELSFPPGALLFHIDGIAKSFFLFFICTIPIIINQQGKQAKQTPAVKTKRETNIARMAPRLENNNFPMDFHGALGALRTIIKERPDAILFNEGANTLDLARGIIDMYNPRKRLDVGTWGVMGIGMGFAIAAAVETGKPVLAVEGDSAFGFSGMEIETICRYNLPVCVVIFNNGGIYRGTDVNVLSSDPAWTRFVSDSRYDRMMEAFGGVGVHATTPDELKSAVDTAMDSGKPTLINAAIDPAAGSESGRIGNLNPQSKLRKK